MKFPLSFVATVSRSEFLRLLPAAVGSDVFADDGDVLTGASGWRIRLAALPEIAFGRIPLERLQVDFSFDGWSAVDVDAFMRRFSLHFQRGGG